MTPQATVVRRALAPLALAAALLGAVAGCGTESGAPAPSSSAAQRAFDGRALAAQLPQRVRESGTLLVATNAPYAPNEFTDDSGRLVGFDIDAVTAIADALGLRVDFRRVPFDRLIPGVRDGEFDLAARALFDTKQREQQVDMVTYFNAGVMWAQRTGGSIDPNDACGKRVGVEEGTFQAVTGLPAKSEACAVLGQPKIAIVGYPDQDGAMAALERGDVDAVSADSTVIQYGVKQSNGRLAAAGRAFDTRRYAYPVRRGSALGPVLQQTVQHLIDTGDLAAIAARWGLDRGVVKTSMINGAVS